jgi:hypothetical protein
MKVDGLTNDEVKSHLQVRNCLEKKTGFFYFFCRSSLISSICSHFALHFEHLGRASEVSSPHSAPELGGGGGPERRHQRRCAAGRTAVRRGGGHLGATAGVRCRCRCGSRSAAAAAAAQPQQQQVHLAGDASGTTTTAADKVYAPVATTLTPAPRAERQSSSCSGARRSGDACSGSPAVSSSSSQTASA